MTDEITESAKAVQEVAKTARTSIEATEKLGRFVSRITNEPLETIMGIINDRLQFTRWKRRLRLVDRADEILKERNIEGHIRVVPPKLALPIIENASLEENDELQDLWANLLASALDPNFEGTLRAAFIDIIKQVEVVDVHILNFIYESYKESLKNLLRSDTSYHSPTIFRVNRHNITEKLGLDPSVYENSIDNLIRLRCIASYAENKTIESESQQYLNLTYYNDVTHDYRYESVCMTSFGVSFVETCVGSVESSSNFNGEIQDEGAT